MHNDITLAVFGLVGEDAVGLNKFFRKTLTQLLQQVTSYTATGATGNGVGKHKPFQAITVLCLTVNHVKQRLMYFLP